MAQSQAARVSPERLREAIVSFLDGYSIEVTPHDESRLNAIAEVLPAGTEVFVAHPPGVSLDRIVELACRVRELGLTAIPHIISRKLESRDQLDGALDGLSANGIDRALVVGGDTAAPNAAFDSSLEVLQTGLFGKYGFREVGIAGHPEGSDAIGDERAAEALRDKTEFARQADFAVRIVTQFGFDPHAITAWEETISAAGIDLPVRVGMAGPASLRHLIRFAALCGVGASARMLMTRTGDTAKLLRTRAPDDQIAHVARHRLDEPLSRLGGVHFFAFGGVVKTAKWANAVLDGRFKLNHAGSGFTVPRS